MNNAGMCARTIKNS